IRAVVSFGDKPPQRENFWARARRRSAEVCAGSPPLLGFFSLTTVAENFVPRPAGGGSGIRTHDTVSRIHAFQASAFSHSAIPPRCSVSAGPYGRGGGPAAGALYIRSWG